MSVAAPSDYVCRPFGFQTTRGWIKRRVFRLAGSGPTVILIHEAPGISRNTFRIARRLAAEGYSVALPELMQVGPVGTPTVRAMTGMLRFCVARELGAFSTNRTGAIVEWLRALARAECAASHGPVAVIGMCFSGGFALGALMDPAVSAAVMSQPSLPFPLTRARRSDLGLSGDDLAEIKRQPDVNDRVRIMRYALDRKSPVARFDRVRDEFPGCESRQIPTTRRSDHSVLRTSLDAPAGSDLAVALSETLAFLARHLPPGP